MKPLVRKAENLERLALDLERNAERYKHFPKYPPKARALAEEARSEARKLREQNESR